jgi:lauroyl/myristoyl acyltransferase
MTDAPRPAYYRPPTPPARRPWPARVILFLVGSLLLTLALVLPYRARLALGEWLGRLANAFVTGYVRLLAWFLSKLKDDPHAP